MKHWKCYNSDKDLTNKRYSKSVDPKTRKHKLYDSDYMKIQSSQINLPFRSKEGKGMAANVCDVVLG